MDKQMKKKRKLVLEQLIKEEQERATNGKLSDKLKEKYQIIIGVFIGLPLKSL